MKQYTRHITVEEAEQLCRLYIDCQLSVLEETELEYVLMQSGLDSPLISETRTIMGISRSVNFQMPKKHLFLTWGWHVAACVAILIGSIALLQNHITNETDCIGGCCQNGTVHADGGNAEGYGASEGRTVYEPQK